MSTGFHFVGRNSIYNIDLTVVNGSGAIVDADALPVAHFKNWSSGADVWSRTTTHTGLGTYRLTISSLESATPGLYYVTFDYALSAVAQQYRTNIEIPDTSASLYESLSAGYREVVENVWDLFEDLCDSDIGGPNLKMYSQSKFGRERVAQLMRNALGVLNTAVQPHTTYKLAGEFPFDEWGSILERATYIEVVKHLIRSYVEQPQVSGVSVARFDRRDYMDRWNTILGIESDGFRSQLEVFKMSHLNLGRSSVIVAGGIYPEIPLSGMRYPGRPRTLGW